MSTTPTAGSIAKTKEVSNKLGPLALVVGSMLAEACSVCFKTRRKALHRVP